MIKKTDTAKKHLIPVAIHIELFQFSDFIFKIQIFQCRLSCSIRDTVNSNMPTKINIYK